MSRQTDKVHTRAALLKAAITLFSHKGFRRTTIRDIAKVGGYSTGAFFNHWDSKDDIWREITGREPPDLDASLGDAMMARAGQ